MADRPAAPERQTGNRMNTRTLIIWVGAFLVMLIYFYALDHFIMGIQGLPLNLTMSPAQ